MNLQIENDFQKKIMRQSFKNLTVIKTEQDITQWKQLWMDALKSWHSPYKAIIDCQNLKIEPASLETVEALKRMLSFFESFFLKKIVGFNYNKDFGHDHLPFKVNEGEEQSSAKTALSSQHNELDLRGSIQVQNDFKNHVIEVSFLQPVVLKTKQDLAILQSKLTNNLMQWHSKWSLLIDCGNLKVDPAVRQEFNHLERLFNRFYMKQVMGYNPSEPKDSYPFPVFRSRHKAVSTLDVEESLAGDDAQCRSVKSN